MTVTPQHIAAMDDTKLDIFMQNDGAFLASLMCNMDILWNDKIPTAQTNGLKIEFNPDFYMNMPKETRVTVLLHELWHIGLLHPLRMSEMGDHDRANRAADYVVNLNLFDEKYSFDGVSPLLDQQYRGMTMEEVYDQLASMPKPPPGSGPTPGSGQQGCWSNDPSDMDLHLPDDPHQLEEIVQVVHQAVIAQQRTGHSSAKIDAIAEIIKQRNQPLVNWKAELKDFCQEKARAGLNYKKKNRRYSHVILPARGNRGRLTTLFFFFDVSGSVTTEMVEQMYSEVKFIWETLKPKALHIIQFDTHIRKVDIWTEGRAYQDIDIVGRGGTSLVPVADYIEKHKPTGSVIMTDLDCAPMRIVPNASILWLCINNPNQTVQQGKLIHIKV